MDKLTRAERDALRKIASKGGKTAAKNMTDKQREARARKAGKASGRARKKK